MRILKEMNEGVLIVFLSALFSISMSHQSFTEREHRTSGASENFLQLWCYRCRSDIHGDHCIYLNENNTNLIEKCSRNHHSCIVIIY